MRQHGASSAHEMLLICEGAEEEEQHVQKRLWQVLKIEKWRGQHGAHVAQIAVVL